MRHIFAKRMKKALDKVVPDHKKPIIIFSTSRMASDIALSIDHRIKYFVDNDPNKQGALFCNKAVHSADVLSNEKGHSFILVASTHYEDIAAQLQELGLTKDNDFFFIHEQYFAAWKIPVWQKIITNLFNYKKDKKYKKILVLGGYGFQNTGDEAQLNANLQELKSAFPDHLIKVLSPNPVYTHLEHERCAVSDAPRVAFYDLNETALYKLKSSTQKIRFLLRSTWLYFNTILIRAGLPTFFIKAKRSSLLHEISTSDLIYFSGGGYLTGSTLPRLWDGIFFFLYASSLDVPVVLSGQTIGVWNSSFTRRLAKIGFSKVSAISTRDNDQSPKDLTSIGIHKSKIFPTFDDALFCDKMSDRKILDDILRASGMKFSSEDKRYIAFHFHFWGLKSTDEKKDLLIRIENIAREVLAVTNLPLLGIPMVPSDQFPIQQLMEISPDLDLTMLKYSFDFRVVRSSIAHAEVCISMKHHPLIFALGEGVPPISLAMGKYYEHKNKGALGLFGLEHLNVSIDADDYLENFKKVISEVSQTKNNIRKQTQECYPLLKGKRKKFMQMVKSTASQEFID